MINFFSFSHVEPFIFQNSNVKEENKSHWKAKVNLKDLLLVPGNPTSRRRAVYSHSGAISHNKIEDYGHSDGRDQSV